MTSPTHDISLVDYHIADLEAFGKTLSKAAQAAFPVDGRSRYSEVHVLLLFWEDDNLGVIREIAELVAVFRDEYKYATEAWRIPSYRAHTSLGKRITKFVDDFESSKSLLVVYYGGHGHMNDDRQCIWSRKGEPDCPTVQWFGLQTMLEQADSDVLILLDCCAAASSAAGTGNGITEVVAACGFETWAPGVCEHSFTRGLIEELRYWSQGPPLSVALLHNKILSRMKYWKPRYGLAGCGMTGHPELRKTPIYIVLGNERRQRSIELTPLQLENLLVSDELGDIPLPPIVELPAGVEHNTGNIVMGSTESTAANVQECNAASLKSVWPDSGFRCPKVLIALALQQDQPLRTEAWAEWLTMIPAVVRYAHVEGVYESDSNLVLCSVPVAVWDLIPPDPAIKFIAFIKSGNRLKSTDTEDARTQTNLHDQESNEWSQQKNASQNEMKSLWSQGESRPVKLSATVESAKGRSVSRSDSILDASGSLFDASESSFYPRVPNTGSRIKGVSMRGWWICHLCEHLNEPGFMIEQCRGCEHMKCATCTIHKHSNIT